MAQTLFRDCQPGQRMEVISLELFFDLVFVFAVTQISHLLLKHLNWLGALEAALLLMVVWWAWSNSTWMTNLLDPGHCPVALMLLALMGVGLVFSSSLPEAFGSMGLIFALSFVTFQLSCTLFMGWATRSRPAVSRNFLRVALWLIGTAPLWIAGSMVEEESRLWVWARALFIDYLAPVVAFWVPVLGRSDTHHWGVTGLHVAERYGLVVMIALDQAIAHHPDIPT
jgi:low temperature requirement protein LtrA